MPRLIDLRSVSFLKLAGLEGALPRIGAIVDD